MTEVIEPVKPLCKEVSIEQTGDEYIVRWLPDKDPIHLGMSVYLNGHLVKNMCRRDSLLNISNDGDWSFFATKGDIVCIDKEAQVFEDDCECENLVQ